MSIGGIFIIVAVVLFFLEVLGVSTIPRVHSLAHALGWLGLLLLGYPLGGPWWRRTP